ncbi:DUF927 domain-containing protein [Pseudoroseomonas cervicalis]|uniref:DUF927 domain-containing protein n=1 Tax=Teichococcus cervicalis TaxID=204525 RepID=UPI00277E7A71|nr:DUF927 domain-containing protein [Pseudoroseomonas cervicalis]MDQ1081465.1 putative DNA primase/helicase [Pseudoroseomonas cervicalis]
MPESELPTEPLDLQAEIASLAALTRLDYVSRRVSAAKRLGIKLGDLDAEVKRAQQKERVDRAATARALPRPGPGEVRWPTGIEFKADGLYLDQGKDAAPIWLAAPFDVWGEARTLKGSGWSLAIRWRDGDGRMVSWIMPRRLLMVAPGELEAQMMDRGLRIAVDPGARLALRKALGEVVAGTMVTAVSRAGWHATPGAPSAYMLPDGETIGETGEMLMLASVGEEAVLRCSIAGTLAGWRAHVAAKAVGNPLATFCIACAFAGPLLLPMGEVSGGFHLSGGSKGGKTTACQAAASVWGPPQKGGVLRDWNSTANAVEAMAEEAGDGLLILDEIHQADPQTVVGTIYALAGEGGKSRLKEDATARQRRTWRTFPLSNGEVDLANVAAKAGQRLPAGAAVRLPSLPIEGGGTAWPNLHGAPDFPAFMKDLHAAMRAHYGHAARAFIERLSREWPARPEALRAELEASRAHFMALLPKDAETQAQDVARRFALVAAAGELATAWQVTGWPSGVAKEAAEAHMRIWLAARQGGAAAEDAEAVERVRRLIAEHGDTRFPASNEDGSARIDDARPTHRRAGFRKVVGGELCFLVYAEIWREEVFAGADATAAARTLLRRGFLVQGEGGKLQRNERVPGFSKPSRFYVIRAAIMSGE